MLGPQSVRRPRVAWLLALVVLLASLVPASAAPCRKNACRDRTPPVGVILTPAAGAVVSGTLSVSGTATDNVQVALVEVKVDDGAYAVASGTSTWSATVDTTALANGTHTLTARFADTSRNTSSVSITVDVRNPASSPSSSSTSMVTPEGVRIEVSSAGGWTAQQIYDMLLGSARQLALIGPNLTIKVQDTYASQTVTSASASGGVYTSFRATIYLKGVSSTFVSQPDAVLAHEYGHAWSLYHLYMTQNGDWSRFLKARWTSADGSVTLATDPRLDSSYAWDRGEIIADDYRLLFGSAAAIAQRPVHMNTAIPDPRDVPGLRDFLLRTWGGG
jgi:hypothetical protein